MPAAPWLPDDLVFSTDEQLAIRLDAIDPLSPFRLEFERPTGPGGTPLVYLTGHSLGLMPRRVRQELAEVVDAWSRHGVDGWWMAHAPWFTYQETVRDGLARLTGARPAEVVTMNTLTVNLHLMLASFYRPTARRNKVLMEAQAFPSDRYAVASHVRLRGYDPADVILFAEPRRGEACLRTEDVEGLLHEHGRDIALVFMGAVNHYTGQCLDLPRLADAAHQIGALFGADLAHAIGNVPLDLHDWAIDCAVWCSYKYLNGGPGAIGGAFVHEDRTRDAPPHRLSAGGATRRQPGS